MRLRRLTIYLGFLLFLCSSAAKVDFAVSPVGLVGPSLHSPSSIAFHPSGFWVVSDTGNDRIVLLNIDLSVNSTLTGVLKRPRGVAVDQEGRIWVSDGGNDRVVVFNEDLSIHTTFGSSGSGPGEFHLPWGIASDGKGGTAIADALNRRIQAFDSHGSLQDSFGSRGTNPGEFDGPLDIAFDSSGRLFVVDTYLEAEGYVRRVQIFNPDFTFNRTIWDIQNRLRFTRPVGIGISPEDIVAVADHMANRIYFFDSEGTHMGGITTIRDQPNLRSPYDVAFGPMDADGLLMGIVEREDNRIRLVRFSMPEMPLLVLCMAALVFAPPLIHWGEK